ncbi:hypothetical protein ACHAW5_000602 [Stephanodiscus triporus]|uniref:Uncharacterized protein n=1 Tax=Stephanodiscus triporus TaxID=2934178 RepID=A0ABD3P7Z5_9STRA
MGLRVPGNLANFLLSTKRQERVGQVVRSELASLLHRGNVRELTDEDAIGDELRRRINVVHADVSPDLRQARVTISVLSAPSSSSSGGGGGGGERERRANDAISRRRAYAWLVRNARSIRHSLSSRMSHMKGGSPELNFVQVDVGGAVDVMRLIEKVTSRDGYKREELDGGNMSLDDMIRMEYEEGGEYDDDDDDDGWVDEEDDEEDDDDEEGVEEEEEGEEEEGEDDDDKVEDDDGWVDFDEEDDGISEDEGEDGREDVVA